MSSSVSFLSILVLVLVELHAILPSIHLVPFFLATKKLPHNSYRGKQYGVFDSSI